MTIREPQGARSEHASQFSTNQSILMGSVSASNEKVICRIVCFKRLAKFQVKKRKGLIGLQDSYQDRLVFFNVHMYHEFHVPDVLIVLLYM